MILAAVALAALTPVHLPVTTTNPAAQAAVDRGLFFYYAFNRGAAKQAFARAAALDPHLAMAYWGEALAEGPDLNAAPTPQGFSRAQAAIAHAVTLESGASAQERSYIDAMALRYKGGWAQAPQDEVAYRRAMLALGRRSSDPNALMLAAEAYMEDGRFAWRNGAPQSPQTQRALALVDAELARDPNDVMANHLCIHLYDEAPDRAPARVCAKRLDSADLPPEAEHLAHMPAHYWIETGAYAAAVASSDRAVRLFAQLDATTGHDPEHDAYLAHDVYVGYSAAMMLGDYARAQSWAQRMDAASEVSFDALTALRFGRYSAAVASTASASAPSALAVRGFAELQLGNVDEARAIAQRLRKLTTAGDVVDLFFARLAESDGRYDEATRWIDRAQRQQEAAFGGELIPLLPAQEARAGLLLRRGAFAAAITAYQTALCAYPNDPRALFGLATALQDDGRPREAARMRAQFDAAWTGADTTLTVNDLP